MKLEEALIEAIPMSVREELDAFGFAILHAYKPNGIADNLNCYTLKGTTGKGFEIYHDPIGILESNVGSTEEWAGAVADLCKGFDPMLEATAYLDPSGRPWGMRATAVYGSSSRDLYHDFLCYKNGRLQPLVGALAQTSVRGMGDSPIAEALRARAIPDNEMIGGLALPLAAQAEWLSDATNENMRGTAPLMTEGCGHGRDFHHRQRRVRNGRVLDTAR